MNIINICVNKWLIVSIIMGKYLLCVNELFGGLEMIGYIKIYIASSLFVYFVLFGWIDSYELDCRATIFPLLVLILISYSFMELKMQERLCFRDCFLKNSSVFAKILSSRWFATVVSIIISATMTVSAMVFSIHTEEKIWLYIFTLHTFFVIILIKGFDRLLYGTVNDSYRGLLAREWTINISSIVLVFVAVYVYYNGYEPTYLRAGLEESIINASNSISSNCALVESILKVERETDALFWWLITNSSGHIESSALKLGAWILFLLFNSLAILGINRFIIQVVYILNIIFKRSGDEK